MRLLALTVLGLAGLAAPTQADETIIELVRPASLDADRGRIAYSAYDTASRLWRLMVRRGDAAPRALPGAPKQSRFDVDVDVDLGPGPRGTAVAVYSRCGGPRRCEIHLYDFKTGRAAPARPEHARRRAQAVGVAPPSRLPAQAAGSGPAPGDRTGRRSRGRGRNGSAATTHLDLRVLARVRRPPAGVPLPHLLPLRHRDQMRLKTFGRAQRLVLRTRSGESPTSMLQPALVRGRLLYTTTRTLSTNEFRRYDPRSGRRRSVRAPSGVLFAASDGRRFAYVMTPYDEEGALHCQNDRLEPAPCLLRRSTRIRFRP